MNEMGRNLLLLTGATCLGLVIIAVSNLICREVGIRTGYADEYNWIQVIGAYVCGAITTLLYRDMQWRKDRR